MTQRIMLSYDELDSAADHQLLWPALTSAGFGFSNTTPLGVGKSATPGGATNNYVIATAGDEAGKTLNLGFPFRIDSLPTADVNIFSLNSTFAYNTPQICLIRNVAGYLQLKRGATVLATGATFIDLDVFHYYQATVLVANAGGVFKVYLNGNPTPEIDYSGDTQNQSTDNVLSVCFGSNTIANSAGIHIGHFVMFDTLGTKNNGLVPETLRKAHMHTTADGDEIWTPSTGATVFNLIGEPIGAPNDTDFGKSSTLNNKNRGVLGSPPSNVGTVAAVQNYSRLAKSNVGTIAVKLGIKAGANEQQTESRYLPAGSPVNYLDTWEYKTGTTEFAAGDITGGTLEVTAEVTAVG